MGSVVQREDASPDRAVGEYQVARDLSNEDLIPEHPVEADEDSDKENQSPNLPPTPRPIGNCEQGTEVGKDTLNPDEADQLSDEEVEKNETNSSGNESERDARNYRDRLSASNSEEEQLHQEYSTSPSGRTIGNCEQGSEVGEDTLNPDEADQFSDKEVEKNEDNSSGNESERDARNYRYRLSASNSEEEQLHQEYSTSPRGRTKEYAESDLNHGNREYQDSNHEYQDLNREYQLLIRGYQLLIREYQYLNCECHDLHYEFQVSNQDQDLSPGYQESNQEWLNDFNQEYHYFSRKYQALNCEYEDIDREYQVLNPGYQEFNHGNQDSSDEYQDPNNENQVLNHEYQDSNHGNQDSNDEYQDSNHEYQDLNHEYQDSNHEYQDLNREYQVLNHEYQLLIRGYLELNREYQYLNGEYQKLHHEYQVSNQECQDLNPGHQEFYHGNRDSSDEYQDSNHSNQDSNNEYQELNHGNQDSNDEYQDSNHEYQDLNQEYHDSYHENRVLNHEYQDSNHEYQYFNQEYHDSNHGDQDSNNEYQELNHGSQDSNDEYQDSYHEYQDLNQEYHDSNHENRVLNHENRVLNHEYQHSNNEYLVLNLEHQYQESDGGEATRERHFYILLRAHATQVFLSLSHRPFNATNRPIDRTIPRPESPLPPPSPERQHSEGESQASDEGSSSADSDYLIDPVTGWLSRRQETSSESEEESDHIQQESSSGESIDKQEDSDDDEQQSPAEHTFSDRRDHSLDKQQNKRKSSDPGNSYSKKPFLDGDEGETRLHLSSLGSPHDTSEYENKKPIKRKLPSDSTDSKKFKPNLQSEEDISEEEREDTKGENSDKENSDRSRDTDSDSDSESEGGHGASKSEESDQDPASEGEADQDPSPEGGADQDPSSEGGADQDPSPEGGADQDPAPEGGGYRDPAPYYDDQTFDSEEDFKPSIFSKEREILKCLTNPLGDDTSSLKLSIQLYKVFVAYKLEDVYSSLDEKKQPEQDQQLKQPEQQQQPHLLQKRQIKYQNLQLVIFWQQEQIFLHEHLKQFSEEPQLQQETLFPQEQQEKQFQQEQLLQPLQQEQQWQQEKQLQEDKVFLQEQKLQLVQELKEQRERNRHLFEQQKQFVQEKVRQQKEQHRCQQNQVNRERKLRQKREKQRLEFERSLKYHWEDCTRQLRLQREHYLIKRSLKGNLKHELMQNDMVSIPVANMNGGLKAASSGSGVGVVTSGGVVSSAVLANAPRVYLTPSSTFMTNRQMAGVATTGRMSGQVVGGSSGTASAAGTVRYFSQFSKVQTAGGPSLQRKLANGDTIVLATGSKSMFLTSSDNKAILPTVASNGNGLITAKMELLEEEVMQSITVIDDDDEEKKEVAEDEESSNNAKSIGVQQPMADNEPELDIVINNVVCSFSVGCHLKLRDIALQGSNVEYRRENGMVTMKLRHPYTTASIWSSGRITCTGATSESMAKVAARRYARCLGKLGFPTRFLNFRIVNVLGTCSMPWAIKIVNFSERHRENASYEPELHPGVTYKMRDPDPKATLKIFSTGSVTVTAASVNHVESAIQHIYPLVFDFRKQRSAEELQHLRQKQRLQGGGDPTELENQVLADNKTASLDNIFVNTTAAHSKPSSNDQTLASSVILSSTVDSMPRLKQIVNYHQMMKTTQEERRHISINGEKVDPASTSSAAAAPSTSSSSSSTGDNICANARRRATECWATKLQNKRPRYNDPGTTGTINAASSTASAATSSVASQAAHLRNPLKTAPLANARMAGAKVTTSTRNSIIVQQPQRIHMQQQQQQQQQQARFSPSEFDVDDLIEEEENNELDMPF
ncbi:uncharacterized protein Dsimw501_GD27042, isoform E [Drosophila simulans]|nr:uncharacterized protein Dsimw501_GD27042, isoform A [Drosophila simulans]KMZ08765.1 uncharacterized protein Dsimw501_GD27042, isoform B [Drosophila simulans]KMZ08767.1 uncharacterized protein Dsimw501_GD27042, isoform D [Drosophila simulans]KMZ08768.1 uncharacterized protein Dsimw501_GD27042, isoform E [Drosophila simulans]